MKHRYLFSFLIIFFCFTFNFTSYAGVLSQRRKARENKTPVKQNDQYITKISGNGVQELKRPVSPLA